MYYSKPIVTKVFDFRRLKNRSKRSRIDYRDSVKVRPALSYSIKNEKTSPVSKVVNLISKLTTKTSTTPWNSIYNNLLDMKKKMELKEKASSSRTYNMRMYDLVLDNKIPTRTIKESKDPKVLIETAFELFSSLRTSNNHTRSYKFLSPRIAPLMPQKSSSDDNFLSPTLLSFYEDDRTIASIPSILKATHLSGKERDEVMTLLMQLSGTTDAIKDSANLLEHLNFADMANELTDVNNRIDKMYKNLESDLSKRQKRDLDTKGFTFMNTVQQQKVYVNNEFNITTDNEFLDAFGQLDRQDKENALWNTIEQVALRESMEDYKHRLKRRKRSSSVTVFSAVILGPYMFAPSFGLTIMGPVILSPSIFSPSILNPMALSPYIGSPGLGMPSILSPYVLSPMVLNPVLMSPLVLSPYVLSPNILTPNLLSPLILSPLVLSPDILSPGGLGGSVLSPAVASPAILTDSFLMATILSPTVFS
ncbi:unnamed protein product [Bursaphelenchus okinawaensis]|uniref:Uncharacterized protein n=1 Tax=Bursaphelenchus okinawaensis TaxID=465554 RepID=A0A811K8A7_9BILA|nr:unnamed protein product [Bursaphelenchus okinawaensis]CAG9093037.1 unnamed protein product [Bursaphelenchus okinawaensis]